MDVAAIAAAMAAARAGQTQSVMAAKTMKANLEAQASIVRVLEAAQENLAALAPGLGQNLDVTV